MLYSHHCIFGIKIIFYDIEKNIVVLIKKGNERIDNLIVLSSADRAYLAICKQLLWQLYREIPFITLYMLEFTCQELF